MPKFLNFTFFTFVRNWWEYMKKIIFTKLNTLFNVFYNLNKNNFTSIITATMGRLQNMLAKWQGMWSAPIF